MILHVHENHLINDDRLNALIDNGLRQSTRELVNLMDCDQATIIHLNSIDKIKKLGVSAAYFEQKQGK